MNIPDKAVNAAQEFGFCQLGINVTAADVQKIVEAAAPHIAAQAFWDFVDAKRRDDYTAGDLVHHAIELEEGTA